VENRIRQKQMLELLIKEKQTELERCVASHRGPNRERIESSHWCLEQLQLAIPVAVQDRR
jgi:hypothetical protein